MRKRTISLLLSSLLLLTGCTAGGSSGPQQPEQQTLTIYTSHPEEVYAPVIREFQERTGIWVFVETGGSLEILERLSAEAAAPQCDVIFGGGAESHEAYAEYLTHYTSPALEDVDERYLSQSGLWSPFSVLPIVIIYNAKLVAEVDAPTSWAALTAPEWQGKIAFADPLVSASCFTALSTLMQTAADPWAACEAFALNVREVLPSSSAIATAVAEGRYPVGVTWERAAMTLLAESESIVICYPDEGTSLVPDATSLVRGAANEAAAKLFIDFTLSRDVQQMVATVFDRRPVLAGMAAPEGAPALDSFTALEYDYDWCAAGWQTIRDVWQRSLDA